MSQKIAYTAEEVAQKLSLSLVTVRRHTRAGMFPCHRIGRAVRYTETDITKYLERWEDEGYAY
jgi:excisionase family DNA binding protein